MSKTIEATVTVDGLTFSVTVATIVREGRVWGLQQSYNKGVRSCPSNSINLWKSWKEPVFTKELKLEARRKAEIALKHNQ